MASLLEVDKQARIQLAVLVAAETSLGELVAMERLPTQVVVEVG
jgi:hypothetical protein